MKSLDRNDAETINSCALTVIEKLSGLLVELQHRIPDKSRFEESKREIGLVIALIHHQLLGTLHKNYPDLDNTRQ